MKYWRKNKMKFQLLAAIRKALAVPVVVAAPAVSGSVSKRLVARSKGQQGKLPPSSGRIRDRKRLLPV